MCFMCDSQSKRLVAEGYVQRLIDSQTHFDKNNDALDPDGVGDLKQTPFNELLILTTDDAADTIDTSRTIEVGGPSIISTIDTIGDQDFFKVTLEAGKTYDIGQYLVTGGPSATPLADAFIDLYDASGKLVVSADGGGPNTPSGLDALLTFTPETSGTFYINARAYDNAAENGTTGDFVGDYELFVTDVTGQETYKPYYDVDSPLYALDWGSQVNKVHQSVRNPDGEEGPRPTGNAAGSPSVNPDAPDGAQTFNITGKNVITVYFAKAGEVYIDSDPTTPGSTDNIVAKGLEQFEIDAFNAAFASIEKVADIDFIVVDGVYNPLTQSAAADFTFVTYPGTPRTGLLGRMSPPDEDSEGQAEFNALGPGWDAKNLVPGGFSYVTLIHEMGHGLGLAHPHDGGGRSGIMRGVVAEGTAFDYTTGDFGLNQGVFTMMSYEDGWQDSPYGRASTSAGYGYNKGPMAFDIAVLQDKYGVNEETATGDDSYVLSDVNARGTGWESIWDAGGTDEVVYDGTRDATVDLRPATLQYEVGGGGFISHVYGIFGGYTVANGVTIENVRTGAGNDVLNGNDVANKLIAGSGNDQVNGFGGDDAIYAGAGADTLAGGSGNDVFLYAEAADSGVGVERDVVTDFVQGEDKIDLDQLGGRFFIGNTAFSGEAGQVNYEAGDGVTVVRVDVDGDSQADVEIQLDGLFTLDNSDFLDLTPGGFRLVGTSGADNLLGGAGEDTLIGLAGNDVLNGGGGSDTADYSGHRDNFKVDLAVTTGQTIGKTGGVDTLASIENLIGGAGANQFYGTAGNNRLDGGAGNDILDGRGGDDVLIGGLGKDQVGGRTGADTFLFRSVDEIGLGTIGNAKTYDRISDFVRGVDKIDLSAIDAISGTAEDDAFSFIGANTFSKTAGELRYTTTSSGTLLAGDVNGDGLADFEILLLNKAIPTNNDFLL